jgi:hypothetical protein
MSVSSQIQRLNNAKAAIKDAIAAKGVTVPDEATLDALAGYITQIEGDTGNADTVDGYHIAVRSDGTAPPSGTTNTITFVYGG